MNDVYVPSWKRTPDNSDGVLETKIQFVPSSLPNYLQQYVDDLEAKVSKRTVKTPKGARHYDQPIGSPIVADVSFTPDEGFVQRLNPTPKKVPAEPKTPQEETHGSFSGLPKGYTARLIRDGMRPVIRGTDPDGRTIKGYKNRMDQWVAYREHEAGWTSDGRQASTPELALFNMIKIPFKRGEGDKFGFPMSKRAADWYAKAKDTDKAMYNDYRSRGRMSHAGALEQIAKYRKRSGDVLAFGVATGAKPNHSNSDANKDRPRPKFQIHKDKFGTVEVTLDGEKFTRVPEVFAVDGWRRGWSAEGPTIGISDLAVREKLEELLKRKKR